MIYRIILLISLLFTTERGPWLLIGRIPDRNPYGCTPSASGTYVGPAASITDSTCAVWTLGAGTTPNITILRNGSQPASAFGAKIEYYMNIIYVQGDDLNWYSWNGSSFDLFGSSDPSGGNAPTGYFVSTIGSDNNTCIASTNVDTPKATISNAIQCLSAGDTLWVRGGIYPEMLHSGMTTIPSGTSWSNKVRIAAYPGESPIMRPSGTDFVIYLGSSYTPQYIEFDGINLDGSNIISFTFKIEAGKTGSVVYDAHHIRLQNAEIQGPVSPVGAAGSNIILYYGLGNETGGGFNEFINLNVHGGGRIGLNQDHAFYVATGNNLIEGCNIHDFAAMGITVYNDFVANGTITTWPSGNVIRGNLIHDGVSGTSGGAGIFNGYDANTLMYNNVIYNIQKTGGGTAGIGIWISQNARVFNNTVYGNANDGIDIYSTSSGTMLRNNISYGNGSDYSNAESDLVQSNNLFSINPIFVNPGSSNFRLQTNSPAKDAATSLSSVFTTDLEGIPRPQGPSWDIGAYELVP